MKLNAQMPYPGLRPFHEEDAEFFSGREEQVRSLRRKVRRKHFTAVVGGSGSGKSSLVRAGLLPALKTERDPEWVTAVMRPGTDPYAALAAIMDEFVDQGKGAKVNKSRNRALLRLSSHGLTKVFKGLNFPSKARLLLVVDQFEELIRYDQIDLNTSLNFVQLLVATAMQKAVPIHIVITLRLDFLGDCARYSGLTELINDGQYLVPALDRNQRTRAIVEPAEKAGKTVQWRLQQRLLNDADDAHDQLPVLQHGLMRLWKIAGDDREITIDHYRDERIGSLELALSKHADERYRSLPRPLQKTAQAMFKALTLIDRESRGIRRPLTVGQLKQEIGYALHGNDEVLDDEGVPQGLIKVIDHFRASDTCFVVPPINKRLTLGDTVDISHESLIRQWKRLSGDVDHEIPGWLREERDDGRAFETLVRDALNWQQGTMDPYTGNALKKLTTEEWFWRERRGASWGHRFLDDDLCRDIAKGADEPELELVRTEQWMPAEDDPEEIGPGDPDMAEEGDWARRLDLEDLDRMLTEFVDAGMTVERRTRTKKVAFWFASGSVFLFLAVWLAKVSVDVVTARLESTSMRNIAESERKARHEAEVSRKTAAAERAKALEALEVAEKRATELQKALDNLKIAETARDDALKGETQALEEKSAALEKARESAAAQLRTTIEKISSAGDQAAALVFAKQALELVRDGRASDTVALRRAVYQVLFKLPKISIGSLGGSGYRMALSADKKHFVSGDFKDRSKIGVALWKISDVNGEFSRVWAKKQDYGTTDVAFSADGRLVMSVSERGLFTAYDRQSGKTLHSSRVDPGNSEEKSKGTAYSMDVAPDDRHVYVTQRMSGGVRRINLRSFTAKDLPIDKGLKITEVKVSPNGEYLAVGSSDGKVLIVDRESGKENCALLPVANSSRSEKSSAPRSRTSSGSGNLGRIYSLDYSPNGRWLAIAARQLSVVVPASCDRRNERRATLRFSDLRRVYSLRWKDDQTLGGAARSGAFGTVSFDPKRVRLERLEKHRIGTEAFGDILFPGDQYLLLSDNKGLLRSISETAELSFRPGVRAADDKSMKLRAFSSDAYQSSCGKDEARGGKAGEDECERATFNAGETTVLLRKEGSLRVYYGGVSPASRLFTVPGRRLYRPLGADAELAPIGFVELRNGSGVGIQYEDKMVRTWPVARDARALLKIIDAYLPNGASNENVQKALISSSDRRTLEKIATDETKSKK